MRKYNPPTEPYLSVVYEDSYLLVMDKPSGLLSVPGRGPANRDSLASRVQERYPEALTVHRLDMDTSGLLIMARNPEVHRKLSMLFQNREVEKTYYARVWGVPKADSGEIDLPLICDWPNRPKQRVDFKVGKPSVTHWKKVLNNKSSSLIRLKPITGRSHQLRVHMQEIGHPILGDPFYANREAQKMSSRLLLHASYLELIHPAQGCIMKFSSKLGRAFFSR